MDENAVVSAVKQFLEADGFQVKSLTTKDKGHDIEATKPGELLMIEAKGATSARKGSNRNGKPFTSSQVKGHVAKAVWKAMEMKQLPSKPSVGVAFPKTKHHEYYVNKISAALKQLNIAVYWVSEDGTVQKWQ